MATPIQRAQAWATALLDKAPTETQLRAVAHAYAMRANEQEIIDVFGHGRDRLTDEQKCIVLLEMVRREVKGHLRYTAEQGKMAEAGPHIKAAGDAAEALF